MTVYASLFTPCIYPTIRLWLPIILAYLQPEGIFTLSEKGGHQGPVAPTLNMRPSRNSQRRTYVRTSQGGKYTTRM